MGVVGRGVSRLLRVWSWLCAGRFTCAVWREWAFCVRAQALRAFWRVTPQMGQVVCPGLNALYGANLAGVLENLACNSASTPSGLEVAPLRCRCFRRSLKFELREMDAEFGGTHCFLTTPRS